MLSKTAWISMHGSDIPFFSVKKRHCQTERYLRSIAEQFGETTNLAILDGAEMVYLNVVESNQRVMLAVPIGQRPPAFCTASGKSCLGLFTPNTINSRETYLEY